jgi:hypothetical protein
MGTLYSHMRMHKEHIEDTRETHLESALFPTHGNMQYPYGNRAMSAVPQLPPTPIAPASFPPDCDFIRKCTRAKLTVAIASPSSMGSEEMGRLCALLVHLKDSLSLVHRNSKKEVVPSVGFETKLQRNLQFRSKSSLKFV